VVPLAGHPLPVGGPGADGLGGDTGAAHGIWVTETAQTVPGVDILGVGVVVGFLGVKRSPGERPVLQDVDLVVGALGAAVTNLQEKGGKGRRRQRRSGLSA
jgi:hypothetical protein